MKKTFLFLLFCLCSYTAQAQITTYNNAQANNFYNLGGYSYTQKTFPGGVQASPYVISGPSPQNDFSFAVSATGGFNNVSGFIVAANPNTDITIKFFNNNVRKFGSLIFGVVGILETNDLVNVTATTNLGATQTVTTTGAGFVGFNVTGVNEYLVSITATFQTPPSPEAKLGLVNVIFGDNSSQNVALNFDGADDYVSIPSNVGNFGTNDNFTVSCWFRPNPSANGEQELIGKWDFSSGTNFAFTIRYNGTNGTTYAGQFADPTFSTVGSSTDLRDGKWHHIAFTKNASILELVVDGVSAGTGTDNATGETTNGLPLNIGRRGGSGSNYFKGEIDEVRILTVGKTQSEIQNEMFCILPSLSNSTAFFKFNNGVPHGDNSLITQVPNIVGLESDGTLNNFAKTGDASNFVTGQVKYVYSGAEGNYNGSSWLNGFFYLQSALTATTCNDLFEVYVARGFYKPDASNTTISFNIPSRMRIYGGFAGTEKSINQRNLALIRTTNETTLSGDLAGNGNDTPFNFTINRGDNSNNPVNITGNNVVFDGFTVSGSSSIGAGILSNGTNTTIKNSRIIDNTNLGLNIFGGGNATIANCSIIGNKSHGINIGNSSASIKECLIANNGFAGINILVDNGIRQTTITNSTIASNADYGINVFTDGGISKNTLKNTLIYDNASGGIFTTGSGITNTITYSLVQGITTGTGNLNGNTVNPQFVSPLANSVRSDAGDYRLKWCSLAINAGDNTGISPLDLDRKPRNFNTTADMGAYEFLGNTPSQLPTSTISGTIDSPTYAGGAIQTITSTAKILAPAGAIDFKAPNSIILSPGFEARGVGKYFKAEIGGNVGCSN